MRGDLSKLNKYSDYFLAIAKEKNISKAARKLFISQSYLSQCIIKLEKELNVKLFDRSSNPIGITPAGEIYQDYLEASNKLHKKLSSELDILEKQRANLLNLGFAPWRGSTVLPSILPLFLKEHPNVKIILHEHQGKELFLKLDNNVIDILIMNAPPNINEKYSTEFILNEKILLLGNRNSPIVRKIYESKSPKNRQLITLDMLENEYLIIIKQGEYCGRCENNYINNSGIIFKNKIITTCRTTAINLVAEKIGFCFMPESGRSRLSQMKDLVFFDMHSPDLLTPLAVIYKKNSILSNAAKDFIGITKEYYSNEIQLTTP